MKRSFLSSELYKFYLDEKNEILTYRWLESEKLNYDIGWFRAQREWNLKHRKDWLKTKNPLSIKNQ